MVIKRLWVSLFVCLLSLSGCSLTEIRCNMQRVGSNPDIVNFPECREALIKKQREQAKETAEEDS